MKPLGWGLDEEDFFTKLPYCKSLDKGALSRCISINQVKDEDNWCPTLQLRNMQGDCGTLLLYNANYVKQLGLQRVHEVASGNGFDTVIATLVDSTERLQEQLKVFLENGWTIAFTGKSNRKEGKKDKVCLTLHIDNCKWKGY